MRKLNTITEIQLLNCAYTHILGLWCKKLDQLEEHKKADLPTDAIEYWLNKYRKQLDEKKGCTQRVLFPEQITLSLGISSKLSVEFLDDFYEGVEFACKEAGVDLVGGDTSASVTGFVINITAVGRAKKSEISYRSGAKEHDLICLTGNLGASYMGLRLLERERRVLQGLGDAVTPKFEGYEYLLERYLKPRARYDMVESLRKEGIVPTSMIDITDGLASEVLQICKASKCGARIYLERMPLAQQTTRLAEEMNFDAVVAALNGGEDYELLFTVPLDMREKIINLGCVDIIGHITAESTGAYLVTPDGNDIALKAQGFTPKQ